MSSVEVREYLRPLIKWWWLLAAATLVAALSSFVYTMLQPAVYEARTTLMVGSTIEDPNPSSTQVFLTQQLAETYADIAKRTPIKQATMQALNMEWLPYYDVSVIPNTQIIEIRVYDEEPNRSYAVAAELVSQLILKGPTGEQKRITFVDEQLNKLQVNITDTENEIAQKQEDLGKIFSAREIVAVQNQTTALQTKLTTLQANYAALLANTQKGATNALHILEPAVVPTEPTASNLLINVLIAAMIGFVLAAGGAFLIEYLDDSIKSADDAQKALDMSVLSSIPLMKEPVNETDRLVMLQNTPAPATEAYRVLRTNLQFTMVDRQLKLLLVTSPSPMEGKSLTAANLAAALARGGKRVVLMDVDMHRPTQHRLFRLINNIGLTTALLSDSMPIESLLQKTSVPGLYVLATGPLPPNPAELLGSRRMQDILTKLKERADIVVMDSPPVLAVADAVILSSLADAVLMVVRSGKTRREWAKQALNSLNQVKARVVGVVVNGITKSENGYYSYSYYNNYSGPRLLTGPVAPNTQNNGNGQPVQELAQPAMPAMQTPAPMMPTAMSMETMTQVKQPSMSNGNSHSHGRNPLIPPRKENL